MLGKILAILLSCPVNTDPDATNNERDVHELHVKDQLLLEESIEYLQHLKLVHTKNNHKKENKNPS